MSYYNEEISNNADLIGFLKSIKKLFLNNEICKFSVETENYDTENVYKSYLQLKYKNLIIDFRSSASSSNSETRSLEFTAWDINKKTRNEKSPLIYLTMIPFSSSSIYDTTIVSRSIGVFLLKTNDLLIIGLSPYDQKPLLNYFSKTSQSVFCCYEEKKNFFAYWTSEPSYNWIDGTTSMKYSFKSLINTPKDNSKIIFVPKTQLVNAVVGNAFEDFYEGMSTAAGATVGDFYSFNNKVYFAIFPDILVEAGEKIKYNPPQEANT